MVGRGHLPASSLPLPSHAPTREVSHCSQGCGYLFIRGLSSTYYTLGPDSTTCGLWNRNIPHGPS